MNWWHRNQKFEHVWFLFLLLVVMFTVIFVNALLSRAAACLTIDVPPQAVLRNYDGDTFTVFAFAPSGEIDIRVAGVDTPERTKREPGWEEAKRFTAEWLRKGTFHVQTCGDQTFGRIVGLVTRNGESLADALIAAGHVK